MMVIDPDPQVHDLMAAFLSRLNIEVIAVHSAREAISCYKELLNNNMPPDVVVTALNLMSYRDTGQLEDYGEIPLDGAYTARLIRQMDPDATIIGFTALADTIWSDKLKRAGAEAVYGKSIGFDSLATKIQDILS
ncbi:MAG: response regulator [Thermoplasmatota archaeon]